MREDDKNTFFVCPESNFAPGAFIMLRAKQKRRNVFMKTIKIVFLALFTAVCIVLVSVPFLRFPIFPQANFLIYDIADVPMLIAGFAFGPVAGLAVVVAASVYQGLFIDLSSGGVIGIIMHILASGSLVLVSGMIYRRGKTRSGAYIGLFFGAVAMIVTMVLWNLIFTPIFLNAPRSEVLPLLPLIAAFNAVKAGVNSIITALLYKTVSKSINAVIKEYETGRPGK